MRPKFTWPTSGKYDYNQDEVLHRDGEWFIRKTHFPESEWNSYVHHRFTKNVLQQNPWVGGQPPNPLTRLKEIECEWSDLPLFGNKCTKCYNIIPKGIMGLWTMHNWDQIQNRTTPR